MKKVLYFSGDAPILENFHFVNDIFFNLFGFCVDFLVVSCFWCVFFGELLGLRKIAGKVFFLDR